MYIMYERPLHALHRHFQSRRLSAQTCRSPQHPCDQPNTYSNTFSPNFSIFYSFYPQQTGYSNCFASYWLVLLQVMYKTLPKLLVTSVYNEDRMYHVLSVNKITGMSPTTSKPFQEYEIKSAFFPKFQESKYILKLKSTSKISFSFSSF